MCSRRSSVLRVFAYFQKNDIFWFLLDLNLFLRYDDPGIIAGAGTMGLEIMQQVDKVDAVIVPVGGGGLIAGVAVAVKKLSPKTLVIVSILS